MSRIKRSRGKFPDRLGIKRHVGRLVRWGSSLDQTGIGLEKNGFSGFGS